MHPRASSAASTQSPAYVARPDLPRPSPAAVSSVAMHAAIDRGNAKTLEAMEAMLATSQQQMMASLGPMFKTLFDSQEATRVTADQRKAEDAEDERLTQAVEEFKAQEDLRKGLAQSREQARVDNVLPPSHLRPDAEARMRGGAQRINPRMDLAELLKDNTGDLTQAQVERLAAVLQRNSKVDLFPSPSVSPLSVWGGQRAGEATRSSPALFGHLQQHGLAPPAQSEVVVRS